MQKRLLMPMLALLAVCSYTLSAAQDSEIQQLREMIRAQNAKIANLERAQAANQTTGRVDKAIAGKCYLSPDQPDINGVGLSFTGEFLYWTVQRSKDVVGQWVENNPANPISPYVSDTVQGGFGWDPGFRLGLKYQLPHDGWDLGVNYTYFRGDGEDTYVDGDLTDNRALTSPYAGTMSLAFGLSNGPVAQVRTEREFSYDQVNMELGRNTAISETLSLRLFGGFSAVWTDMETDVNYYGASVPAFDGVTYGLQHKNRAESTMFGIRLGGDAEMKLGYGFSLLGKAAGALYAADTEYTTFEAYDGFFGITPADGIVQAQEIWSDTSMDDYRIVPAIEVEAGVAWEKVLLDNLNFKVFAGYQFRNYFGLYERRTTNFDATEVDSDIGLHGLVFRVGLDF